MKKACKEELGNCGCPFIGHGLGYAVADGGEPYFGVGLEPGAIETTEPVGPGHLEHREQTETRSVVERAHHPSDARIKFRFTFYVIKT